MPSKEEQKLESPVTIIESAVSSKYYQVYFNTPIDSPQYYVDLCHKLRTCGPGDVFVFHMNTPGGQVDSGVQIIHAMRDCPGRVIAVLDGTVASMGAIIFLAADEFIVHDTARMMLHNYSGGVRGKGHEQLAHLNSTSEWFKSIMRDVCCPFISEEELQVVTAGTDLWMNSDEVRERLNVVKDFAEREYKERIEIEQEREEQEVLKRIEARGKSKGKVTATRSRKKAEPKTKSTPSKDD